MTRQWNTDISNDNATNTSPMTKKLYDNETKWQSNNDTSNGNETKLQ